MSFYVNRLKLKEETMTQKTVPGMAWDGLVQLFLESFEIPSMEEINMINQRLDRLERLICQGDHGTDPEVLKFKPVDLVSQKEKDSAIASDVVLKVIEEKPRGADFKAIKAATSYNDKKLRNIIFRLDKIGRIKRVKRGIYKKA